MNVTGEWNDIMCGVKYGFICETSKIMKESNVAELCCKDGHACRCPTIDNDCDPSLEVSQNKKYLLLMGKVNELKRLEEGKETCRI